MDANQKYNIAEGPCRCICGEPPCRVVESTEESSSADDATKTKPKPTEAAEEPCKDETKPPPQPVKQTLKEYLELTVAPLVLDGFQAVLQNLPPEPIRFLEEFYLKEPNKCRYVIPTHL